MEKANSFGLARTKSGQLVESVVAALKSPPSSESIGMVEGGGTLSKKSSRRMMVASPGRGGGKNTHIGKSRSAQLKLELDEVSNGAALSRASSASLGLSFSFTGFTLPPDEIADSKPFSDDDIPEDIEAGTHKPKFQTEPTLPIYVKATMKLHLAMNATNRTWVAIAWSGSVLYEVSFHVTSMYKTARSFQLAR